jgi:antitoxin CptB
MTSKPDPTAAAIPTTAEIAAAAPSADLDSRRRRATYRATYRGTKEMDWLIGKYADAKLPAMDADALSHFERFLVLPDPDLNIWLMDPKRVTAPEFAELIDDIRAFHGLDGTLDKPMTATTTGTER